MSATRVAADLDPRRFVESVTFIELAAALFDGDPLALVVDDSGTRWTCLRCGIRTTSGGTAVYRDDGWRVRCSAMSCRASLTRIAYERAVLEDADALAALYRIVREREAT